MALIKTPDGGFYVNDDEFEVNYSTNSISLTGQGGGGVAGVSSFNGRTGAVVPQDGDYTAEQVGAVSLSGGTMTGNLILNSDPTNNLQAATKQYVDVLGDTVNDILDGTETLPYLPDNGGTLTGALNMGNNKITMGATPTETTDVTNKGYVDGVVKVVSDEVDGIIAGTTPVSVPIATNAKVGGVKIGAGLSVDGEGTLTTAQTYLSTQGGTMDANAVINGTDSLEISIGDASQSAVVGVTQNGVTIEHNTNSDADSSIRAIDNAIEIKANNTTVTVNGTGVALGGAAISGVNSLAGQNSNEIAIESDIDMNSHNLTNVGEISTANGLNIKADSGLVTFRSNNGIALSGANSGYSGIVITPNNEVIGLSSINNDIESQIGIFANGDANTFDIVVGNNPKGPSFGESGGGIIINQDSIISITSPQPINFNNNRLTGVANPTNGSDAVNLTYFQSNLPPAVGKATTSIPGVVKAINGRPNLSEHATLAEVIAAFNQLLGDLTDAGIVISPS